MAVKFAAGGNRFNGSLRPPLPCCSSFPHSFLASSFPHSFLASPSIIFPFLSPKRSVFNGSEFPSLPRPITTRRSVFLGTSSDKLFSASAARKSKKHFSIQRAVSASLEFQGHNDDGEGEFVRQIQDDSNIAQNCPEDSRIQEADIHTAITSASSVKLSWPSTVPQPPAWLIRGEPVPASMEMKANSVHLPLSLRIIKRKRRCQEEGLFKEASESACCSIKKAFSSMVFMVGELQRYTLQMREIPFHENLQVILARVNREMHASFVWLFQHIFSCTPTLMVYVMLLLANFTVCSITHNSAMAAVSSNPPIVSVEQEYQQTENRPQLKSFSVGRAASVGGNGGGGGTVRPVAGATDDGQSDGSCSSYTIRQEETPVWNRIVEEAHRMQARSINESLMDTDTLQVPVSPVTVELEPDNYAEYSETEIMYHKALSQDPDNVLLISNFAQFLSLVLQDHDRAEYYFKRAVAIKPTDAEALHRYANFLWTVRKDLGAAEETYLEAIGADPSNTYYAANYAHFLWNTGGEDTCYPLDSSDAC